MSMRQRPSELAVFVVAVLAPYLTLLAVSVSRSWGLHFWQNLTLQHYRFVLFEYDVTRRAIVNSLLLAGAAATLAVLLGSLATVVGILISYHFDSATSATMALCSVVLFFVVLAVSAVSRARPRKVAPVPGTGVTGQGRQSEQRP